MLRTFSCCCFLSLFFFGKAVIAAPTINEPIYALAHRIAPAYEQHLKFERIPSDNGKDVFELESRSGNVIIKGNNFSSMAVGLNYYLKYSCHTMVSWLKDDPLELPVIMPPVTQKIRKSARVNNRFFLNYCTLGYTMPWWKWQDWERCIDWMALNGINMPLSITGEEAIWYKVWKKLGLSDLQIRSFFTGPAYLPWNRMANIDKWEGPLPWSWINNQLTLQKEILSRERELGMKPVLPAFAGHVPQAIITKFPNAKIKDLGEWGGFDSAYKSFFLDPMDPLFKKIQKEFLTEQTKVFGSNHLYGADPFNELVPPSWEPEYLAKVATTIYQSMKEVDTAATWVQMSWLFFIDREKWTNPRIEAFIKAVPQNKMVLLDYFCENTEVWKITDQFYQQPYIWCYLGNFGGNTMLAGNLEEVEKRMENAFQKGGKNLWGVGSTLEAFGVNAIMYEYVFEKVWSDGPTDVGQWVADWANRRTGKMDKNARAGWDELLKSAYTASSRLGQGTLTNSRPCFKGFRTWVNPSIQYKNTDLLKAWGSLLHSDDLSRNSSHYDIANIGRQVLGNYFSVVRDQFTDAYNRKDLPALQQYGNQMLGLINDIDTLLNTQSSFLLGKWLEDAKDFGINEAERKYYEHDARTIITTWSTKNQSLNDYANRSWAGLMKSFYGQRWKMFIEAVTQSLKEHHEFDEKGFYDRVTTFEVEWTYQHDLFASKPSGNTLQIAQSLYKKYAPLITTNVTPSPNQ